MSFIIHGVYPVENQPNCHLVEAELSGAKEFDWDSLTQEIAGQPRLNWQVPWDEQAIGGNRWVFFFHHLDFSKPLITAGGPVPVPAPTTRPNRLAWVKYEVPS